jgi:hypothetical protein
MTRQVSAPTSKSDTFEGVPGHKRRESISVMSTKPPAVGPRLNRSAALRAEKEKAPPTSFQFKAPVARTPSRAGTVSRPASAQAIRPAPRDPSPPAQAPPKPKPKPRPSSLMAPTIAPRPNKSALLRAAKMEAASTKKPVQRGLTA